MKYVRRNALADLASLAQLKREGIVRRRNVDPEALQWLHNLAHYEGKTRVAPPKTIGTIAADPLTHCAWPTRKRR